jgi:hypothetical protein
LRSIKAYVPSITNLLLLIVFLFLLFQPLATDDLWWHLKTGQLIWQTHSIPGFDVFSFTNFGQKWIAHEWLAEFFLYGTYKAFGLAGLILWQALMATGIFYLLNKIMQLRRVSLFYRLIGLVLAVGGTGPLWLCRPHLWTALFLMGLVWIFEAGRCGLRIADCGLEEKGLRIQNSARENQGALFWLLPPLFVFWVNLHSGYVLGLIVAAIYLVPRKKYLLLAATLAACLINPNTYHIFLFPFSFATGQLANYKYVQEWGRPTVKLVPMFYVLITALAVFFFQAVRAKEKNSGVVWTDMALILLFLLMAFSAVRHVALFVLIALPVTMLLAEKYLPMPLLNKERLENTDGQLSGWPLLLFIAVLMSILLLAGKLPARVSEKNLPVRAVQYIRENNLHGNYFHHYNWGSYLVWELWPEWKVFVDGRNEVHSLRFMEDEYLELINAGPKWLEIIARRDITGVLLPPKGPLVKLLKGQTGWGEVYRDEQAVVFRKKVI